MRALTETSDKIREHFPGFAWMAEVGEAEKGTAKYSEARGIHYSDTVLREEKEENLLYLLQNLKNLIKEIGFQYKHQVDAKKLVEEALEEIGSQKT